MCIETCLCWGKKPRENEPQLFKRSSLITINIYEKYFFLRAPRFKGFRQQDSQELLRYLLDSVRTEEIKVCVYERVIFCTSYVCAWKAFIKSLVYWRISHNKLHKIDVLLRA